MAGGRALGGVCVCVLRKERGARQASTSRVSDAGISYTGLESPIQKKCGN